MEKGYSQDLVKQTVVFTGQHSDQQTVMLTTKLRELTTRRCVLWNGTA